MLVPPIVFSPQYRLLSYRYITKPQRLNLAIQRSKQPISRHCKVPNACCCISFFLFKTNKQYYVGQVAVLMAADFTSLIVHLPLLYSFRYAKWNSLGIKLFYTSLLQVIVGRSFLHYSICLKLHENPIKWHGFHFCNPQNSYNLWDTQLRLMVSIQALQTQLLKVPMTYQFLIFLHEYANIFTNPVLSLLNRFTYDIEVIDPINP